MLTSQSPIHEPDARGSEFAASVIRRVGAWLIDLALVLALSMAVAITQVESFTPAGSLTAAQNDRLQLLEQGTSVSASLGSTTYVLADRPLWITIAAVGLILLIVLALIPANVGGWTPGMKLTGLRVITTSGNRARLQQHVVRNAVGIFDMVPFVIPGLLGWVVASRSSDRQRLGDRVAKTKVVDRRHPERPVDPGATAPRWRLSGSEASTAPASDVEKAPEEAARRWAIQDIDAELAPTVANVVDPDPGPRAARHEVLPPLRREQRLQTSVDEFADPLSGIDEPPDVDGEPLVDYDDETDQLTDDEPSAYHGPNNSVWSDELDAWMYRDPGSGRWLRHDTETGRWVPAD